MPKTASVAASPPVALVAAPESAADQEPDNQPAPEPAPYPPYESGYDAEAIAELTGKLREAVEVASGPQRALKREQAEVGAEIKGLRFHRQIERASHLKTRENQKNLAQDSFPRRRRRNKHVTCVEEKARFEPRTLHNSPGAYTALP